MKRAFAKAAFFIGLTICSVSPVAAGPIPQVGDIAPEFTIELMDGKTFSLSNALQSVDQVYVYFFTPWCESYVSETFPEMAQECSDARQHVQELYESYNGKILFIGISSRYSAEVRSVERYRDKFNIPFALAFDASDSVFSAYGVRHFPTHVVIGKSGKIQHRVKSSGVDKQLLK